MATLSTADQERVRFHCCINEAIYDGDRLIVSERIGLNYSELFLAKVRDNLDACDEAYKALLELTTVAKQQLVSGDVNRSIVDFEANRKVSRKRYEALCDLVAESLGIPSYRSPSAPFKWRSSDSTYLTRIATPDGTSVGARLHLADNYA
jgi:hypothetical protein